MLFWLMKTWYTTCHVPLVGEDLGVCFFCIALNERRGLHPVVSGQFTKPLHRETSTLSVLSNALKRHGGHSRQNKALGVAENRWYALAWTICGLCEHRTVVAYSSARGHEQGVCPGFSRGEYHTLQKRYLVSFMLAAHANFLVAAIFIVSERKTFVSINHTQLHVTVSNPRNSSSAAHPRKVPRLFGT